MRESQFEQVVYLFVDGQVTSELSYEDFELHLDRQLPIAGAPPGATLCRAGFVLVGPELRVHGLVFFLLQIDAQGRPDKNFNVPLPYLAANAGPGPDLGYGPVPMACRGSCSVPWHANNLWDPTLADVTNPMDAVVSAVQRNRLTLNPAPIEPIVSAERAEDFQNDYRDGDKPEPVTPQPVDVGAQIAEISAVHTASLIDMQRRHEEELATQRELLEAKIELYQQEIARLKDRLEETSAVTTAAAPATSITSAGQIVACWPD